MKKTNEIWTGFERRRFSYTAHSPERRAGVSKHENERECLINQITDLTLKRYVDSILEQAEKKEETDASKILFKLPASIWLPFQ
jgi:hypothetical protein